MTKKSNNPVKDTPRWDLQTRLLIPGFDKLVVQQYRDREGSGLEGILLLLQILRIHLVEMNFSQIAVEV
jgi:hypothetical protein